ncbi:methylenetetrahydrofolate reductase [Sphingomonas hengshuiensis]|uniref:methylenetetrahydrofolate reductase n=1 Tax=Sphingomonas hengshuiensis TaxID=1609977 RepID=UPI0005CA1463|nr:methylenetetrahydrofolate reductase [Sphingomonas hengshuiensis]
MPAVPLSEPQSLYAPPSLLDDASIEITAKDQHHLDQLARGFAPGTPVSITFLPGETFEDRIAAAQRVRAAGFTPVPHISARRLTSVAELEGFVAGLVDAAAVTRVFVVGGDLPQPAGPFEDALAVIRSGILAFHGIEQVGIAGYPEGHPDIAPAALDAAMRDKLDAIHAAGQRAWIATQFSFDAVPVLDWLARLRAEGIDETVRIGVPGPASVKTLLRFATRCGVGVSAKVMTKYGLSLTQFLGNAGPDKLIEALTAGLVPEVHGDARLHFYPFGGLEKTADWVARRG